MHIDELLPPPVGADLSCTPPIYRPGERIDGPLADKSAPTGYYRSWLVKLIIGPRWLFRHPDLRGNLHKQPNRKFAIFAYIFYNWNRALQMKQAVMTTVSG
jgi:hypothetical protein